MLDRARLYCVFMEAGVAPLDDQKLRHCIVETFHLSSHCSHHRRGECKPFDDLLLNGGVDTRESNLIVRTMYGRRRRCTQTLYLMFRLRDAL